VTPVPDRWAGQPLDELPCRRPPREVYTEWGGAPPLTVNGAPTARWAASPRIVKTCLEALDGFTPAHDYAMCCIAWHS